MNAAAWRGVYCLLLLLMTATARAQSGELVLVLPDCPGNEAWRREVRAVFELELRATVTVQHEPQPGTAALSVERACNHSSTEALLRFGDPRTGAAQTRTLSLRDAPPELRARVLAFALVELLQTHWAENTLETSSATATLQPPPQLGASEAAPPSAAAATTTSPAQLITPAAALAEPAQDRTPEREPERPPAEDENTPRESTLALSFGPSLHTYLASGSLLYGVELSISYWRVSLGVLGSAGTNGVDALGRAYYQRVHGFVSFDLARVAFGAWSWAAAVRGALGGTFAQGEQHALLIASRVADLSYDGSLETWLALPVSGGWSAKLRANLGYALGPRFLADRRVLANFSGMFLGVALTLTATL